MGRWVGGLVGLIGGAWNLVVSHDHRAKVKLSSPLHRSIRRNETERNGTTVEHANIFAMS